MEFLSAPWWSALLAIILIDLVLAGDNAIVIALAARSLPPERQKQAIVWGTVGAIAVRSVMTLGVVWLLQIPGLMLVAVSAWSGSPTSCSPSRAPRTTTALWRKPFGAP
jgi:predicted tellurium resistance membrane protein TerC